MARAPDYPAPDPKRIAGYTLAIAFHGSLLLLLLAPMHLPDGLRPPGDDAPRIVWYQDRPTPPEQPPEVPVTRPAAPQPTAPALPAIVQAPQAPAVLVEHGSEAAVVPSPAMEAMPPGTAGDDGDIAPPVQGMALEYAAAPPPAYPAVARRMRHEGTVLLEVLVGTDGRPLRVDVRESSGHRQLDDAARDQVLAHWRFRPALRDGQPVRAVGLVPVNFRLR